MVLEYCNGGTLYDYILQERPSEIECLQIFTQILRGFRKIHSLNFLHRDLKPENILLKKLSLVGGQDFNTTMKNEVENNYNNNKMQQIFKISDFSFAKKGKIG